MAYKIFALSLSLLEIFLQVGPGTSARIRCKLFQELNDMGNTIVMITHDLGVAQSAKRIVRIVDGQLQE